MILIGIDQSLSFTGITVRFPDRVDFYGITHKKHTKWDKLKEKPSNIFLLDYLYVEKSDDNIENEKVKFYNIYTLVNCIKDVIWSVKEEASQKYANEEIEVRMEGISFGSRATTAIAELAALNFMIRQVCYEESIDFKILPPTSVKKVFTGNGQADKDLMMESFFRLFPSLKQYEKVIKMDDIADSYAMTCWSE